VNETGCYIMKKLFTTDSGAPVSNDQNSIIAVHRGPVLMPDVHLKEKLAHFNRERIPKRVAQAKGVVLI
jgi:catalase